MMDHSTSSAIQISQVTVCHTDFPDFHDFWLSQSQESPKHSPTPKSTRSFYYNNINSDKNCATIMQIPISESRCLAIHESAVVNFSTDKRTNGSNIMDSRSMVTGQIMEDASSDHGTCNRPLPVKSDPVYSPKGSISRSIRSTGTLGDLGEREKKDHRGSQIPLFPQFILVS
jgi:hypothetical protein